MIYLRITNKTFESRHAISNKPINLCKTLTVHSYKTTIISILYETLLSSKTMNGVIWSRTQKTFVPISSVPIYAMMQQERLRQSRALEVHNFQLQNLTLTSFQVCS